MAARPIPMRHSQGATADCSKSGSGEVGASMGCLYCYSLLLTVRDSQNLLSRTRLALSALSKCGRNAPLPIRCYDTAPALHGCGCLSKDNHPVAAEEPKQPRMVATR
jgi:hypothetical protein